MNLRNHALFQVTLKAIIKKQNSILLLITKDGYFDFPGGRVDESELEIPFVNCLEREVAEECGSNFHFQVLGPAFIAKRQYHSRGQNHRIVAIYYEALYVSGEVKLSEEHSAGKWIDPTELINQPDNFISVDEFEQFDRYLARRTEKMR